jgi:tRNA(adenine34) deaminase
MSELDHEFFMRRAIDLTVHSPELPFASVIVDRETGGVVAEGWDKSAANPTWHSEIVAINALVASAPEIDGSRLVIYTTAEPCPMCQGAILWAGIETVVFGTAIRFLIDIGWRQIDIPADAIVRRSSGWRCDVIGGVLESVCNDLFLNPCRAAPGR